MCDGAYESFARVYDRFMGDIPYEKWHKYVRQLLREHGICDGLVLELGCGTGTFTELLSADGYDMIGLDSSAEMLEQAAEKRARSGADILYLCQDMREFELYGTVRAVVSVCDSLNYITEEEELRRVFSLVNNYLDPGGLFLFDLKTPYYFREVMGDCVMTDSCEEADLIWENTYWEEEAINEYDLTLFLRRPDGLYERRTEIHRQRAYDIPSIRRLLAQASMTVEAVWAAGTREEVRPDTERVYVLARENGKQRDNV